MCDITPISIPTKFQKDLKNIFRVIARKCKISLEHAYLMMQNFENSSKLQIRRFLLNLDYILTVLEALKSYISPKVAPLGLRRLGIKNPVRASHSYSRLLTAPSTTSVFPACGHIVIQLALAP